MTIQELDDIIKPFKGLTKDIFIIADSEFQQAVKDCLSELSSKYSDGTSYGIFKNTKNKAAELNIISFGRGTYCVHIGDWNSLDKMMKDYDGI